MSAAPDPAGPASSPPLTTGRVVRLWLPLAASWALMILESPIIQGAIARLPDATVMIAAAGIVIAIEVAIESPIIMLLATSTALARTPGAYRVVRRFVVHINLAITVAAALVAFVEPVFDLVVRTVMGVPDPIAQVARPALQVMTLWGGFIGWRRFCQGILIRFGRSRMVGYGTAVRLCFAAGTALTLGATQAVSGVLLGAWSWMAGVTAEVIFIHLVTQPTVRAHLSGEEGPVADDPGYGHVLRYHAPLAATSMLALSTQPLVTAGLARMPEPTENLAAWPVAFVLLLFFRSPGLSLPEVVISQLSGRRQLPVLRRFSLMLAAGSTLALGLFVATPLVFLYLGPGLQIPARLVPFVVAGIAAGILLPGLQAVESWYRGVLMTGGATGKVYWGMGISLGVTAVLVGLSVFFGTPGVPSAVLAICVGMTAACVYLAGQARRVAATLPEE